MIKLIKGFLSVLPFLMLMNVYGGTWTPLANHAPNLINLMLLLPDGTVMAQGTEQTSWYRLTPDIHGSYVNGTWSTLASMNYTRLYYSSDVLTNGMVLVAGGEEGSGSSTSEIYNPLSNTWTVVPIGPGIIGAGGFYDSISSVIANGNVLVAPVYPAANGYTALYITASNTWTIGPQLVGSVYQDEASWVILPDNSILTIDPFGQTSERYIPSLNQWIDDSDVPVPVYNTGMELGAAFLLPNGNAFYLGGNGNTVIYTPSGTTNPGTWTNGPVIPNGFGIEDAPAAMMVNGKILCAVGSATSYTGPTYFFEYDPVANSFSQVSAPSGTSDSFPSYETMMLDLPDGSVLYSHDGTDLYVYHPTGSPLAAGQPAILSITPNNDGSFTLTGTLLNGISEGAAYGDDAQMNSNYPLVRLTNSAGNVYYERTYNWNNTGVMTGNTPVTTLFTNSAGLPPGNYTLVVVANGIASAPFNFVLPPRLKLVRSGTNIIISWPTNAVSYTLQMTTNLGPSTVWNTNQPPPIVLGGQNLVTNKITGSQMFFRLFQ